VATRNPIKLELPAPSRNARIAVPQWQGNSCEYKGVKGSGMARKFKYIYGPVSSWRIGSSMGVDLLSQKEKICSFDCIYCQLGKTTISDITRRLYIEQDEIIKEINALSEMLYIDYITFSGRGEPTLAKNLGPMIKAVKKLRHEPVAVITNSSLMNRQDVREELLYADFVIAKLDASSQESLALVNRPSQGIHFDAIIEGIKEFKKHFPGKLALQIMFMKENVQYAGDIARIVEKIRPDEIQINTPLRPCGIEPLGRGELSQIKDLFGSFHSISVYESQKKIVRPISDDDTLKRRGKI
jgi:wyosine [tRNA(Phe)-imidazoG37] synthetase (radical SAM superfamily)